MFWADSFLAACRRLTGAVVVGGLLWGFVAPASGASPLTRRGEREPDAPPMVTPEGPRRADGWIVLRIRGLLLVRSDVSAKQTDVMVKDGVVTLRGAATSSQQKELTEAIARGVTGVKTVRNEITLAAAAE